MSPFALASPEALFTHKLKARPRPRLFVSFAACHFRRKLPLKGALYRRRRVAGSFHALRDTINIGPNQGCRIRTSTYLVKFKFKAPLNFQLNLPTLLALCQQTREWPLITSYELAQTTTCIKSIINASARTMNAIALLIKFVKRVTSRI